MKDKKIKLQEYTAERVDNITAKITQLEKDRASIFLTVLEHEKIDFTLYDAKYQNGYLFLSEKEKHNDKCI